jgi:hypothetical protein
VAVYANDSSGIRWTRADNVLLRPNPRVVDVDIDPVEEEKEDPLGN